MNHWAKALAILVTATPSLVLGEDFKTVSGKEYKDAIITRVESDGIVLRTHSAIVKLYLSLRANSRNGASGASEIDGCAVRVAARESGDERVNFRA